MQLDEITKKLSNHFKKFLNDDTFEMSVGYTDKLGMFKPIMSIIINEKQYIFNTLFLVSIDNLVEICKMHSLDPITQLIDNFEYELPLIYEKELLEIKLDLLTE